MSHEEVILRMRMLGWVKVDRLDFTWRHPKSGWSAALSPREDWQPSALAPNGHRTRFTNDEFVHWLENIHELR